MNVPVPDLRCYLTQWFLPDLSGHRLGDAVALLEEHVSSMCAEGLPVQLLMALAVPGDELVFGVFAANSADVVACVCHRAGLPAQRLSQAIDAGAVRQR
jgi:hypothetical protein